MKILIGSAWPFANGMHIGHLAGLLPADVIARYYRAKGDEVYFVSGTDCHGTAIEIRARQEGKTPREISDSYHEEFCRCFEKLGFSYDRYGKTSSEEHAAFVKEFHKKMYEGGYIYEKETPQAFCENCAAALADRFVEGKCPVCGERARGDQCEACGTVLDPENLLEPECAVCGSSPVFRPAKHLFIAISKMEKELTAFLDAHPHWRKNALTLSRRYINEGLRDRAITRDLEWGVGVPKEGYEEKRIYVWAENVLGYLSMARAVAEERGESYGELWGPDSRHYYVHGKDNIPFHTIILPALMLANGGKWKLPDDIISSEFLTLEGRKISTSGNWAIWVKDIADSYHPDSVRYFIIANGPEKRDADFTWREFVNSHNGELLGAYGNFVNRTLAFAYKYFDAKLPEGRADEEIGDKISGLYRDIGGLIEKGELKEALDSLFAFVRFGNKYFDECKPWISIKNDVEKCKTNMGEMLVILKVAAEILAPFIPTAAEKVLSWILPSNTLPEIEVLFKRLDIKEVKEKFGRFFN